MTTRHLSFIFHLKLYINYSLINTDEGPMAGGCGAVSVAIVLANWGNVVWPFEIKLVHNLDLLLRMPFCFGFYLNSVLTREIMKKYVKGPRTGHRMYSFWSQQWINTKQWQMNIMNSCLVPILKSPTGNYEPFAEGLMMIIILQGYDRRVQ